MDNSGLTRTQARKIGARKALKSTLYVFLLFEAWMLYTETRGDFANGILFFIDEQLNILVFSFVLLLFLCSWVLGRWAGVKILMQGKSYVLVSLLFGLLSWGILTGYLFLLVAVIGNGPTDWWEPGFETILLSMIIWAAAGWSISRIRQKDDQK